jgi:multiple sugar transport system substrate-binding protein
MYEVVFAKLTSDRNLTKDAFMTELKKATTQAQGIAKSK